MRPFHAFQVTRALSSAGDEMWATALPIYLAMKGVHPAAVGLIFSAGAIGSLIGFLLIPALCYRIKSAKVAAISDVLQLLVFLSALFIIFQGDTYSSNMCWICIQFLTSLFGSIWFGATETLITRVSDNTSAQSAHRWNYFSGSLGPAVGPALAGVLFGLFGIGLIAAINALSFAGQAAALIRLGQQEKFEQFPKGSSFARELSSGAATVWSDLRLRMLTIVPVMVKVFLLGVLPFVAFALGKNDASPWLIGTALSGFSAGNLAGAFFWKSRTQTALIKAYRFDTSLMVVLTVAINVSLFTGPHAIIMAGLTFLAGWCSARYSIALRAMRQLIVLQKNMPVVVASQGFLARLATPVAGILYGSILANPDLVLQIGSIVIFVLVCSYGVFGTYRAFLDKIEGEDEPAKAS